MDNNLKFKLRLYARKRGSLTLIQNKKQSVIGELNDISKSVGELEELCQNMSVLKEEQTFLIWQDLKGKNWLLDFCKMGKTIELKLQTVPEDFLELPVTKMHWIGLFTDFKRSVDVLCQLLQYKLMFNLR